MSNCLELIRQSCLKEEKVTKNGQTQNVHVIVKNSPFQMVCGFKNTSYDINFNEYSFDMKLIYDMDDEKEVSWVKTKPVEFKPTVNDEGNQISFDAVKIKVLSSHHEDNLFRLKLTVWNPSQDDEVYYLLSNPIKVISKPLRSKPKKGTDAYEADTLPSPSPRAKRSHSQRAQATQGKEKTTNDLLMYKIDSLLEEQQQTREELRMLKKELESQSYTPNTMMEESFYQKQENQDHQIKTGMFDLLSGNNECKVLIGCIEEQNGKNMEDSFAHILSILSEAEPSEVFDNVRNLLRTLSTRDVSKLVELVDILHAAGLNEMNKVIIAYCKMTKCFF